MISRTISQCLIFSLPLILITIEVKASNINLQKVDANTAVLLMMPLNDPHPGRVAPSPNCPIFVISGSTEKRAVKIKNNSPVVTAYNIVALNLWPDVTQDASNCAQVAPFQTCTIFLTAGSQTHPPMQINFQGANTTIMSTFISVAPALVIGQAWQGGLVYSINPDGASGQVAAATLAEGNIVWDPLNGTTIFGALDPDNGKANSVAIVNQLSTVEGQALRDYAAGSCVLFSTNDRCSTYQDWYLPAVNQMSELMNSGVDSNIFIGSDTRFWTSTQSDVPTDAFSNYLNPPVSIESTSKIDDMVSSLCVRDFSYDGSLDGS